MAAALVAQERVCEGLRAQGVAGAGAAQRATALEAHVQVGVTEECGSGMLLESAA